MGRVRPACVRCERRSPDDGEADRDAGHSGERGHHVGRAETTTGEASTIAPKTTAPMTEPRKAPTMPCQKRSGRKTVKCQRAIPIVNQTEKSHGLTIPPVLAALFAALAALRVALSAASPSPDRPGRPGPRAHRSKRGRHRRREGGPPPQPRQLPLDLGFGLAVVAQPRQGNLVGEGGTVPRYRRSAPRRRA